MVSERKLRSVDSPYGLVQELLFATAYTQHPYNWPIVGWDQDLRALTLEDCLAYYRTYYHPGNLVAVLAGDVEPEHGRDLVARYFGDLPSPGAPPSPCFHEPPQRGERRAVFKKVSQVEALFAGFHAVALDHADIYPLTVLAVLLSEGNSCRFYQEFVRPGHAAELEAWIWALLPGPARTRTCSSSRPWPRRDIPWSTWRRTSGLASRASRPAG